MFDLMYANPHLHRQYAFLRHNGDDVLLIVANFDSEPVEVSVTIPRHAFDHIGIAPGVHPAVELIGDQQQGLTLAADQPLSIAVSGHDAVIWKFGRGC